MNTKKAVMYGAGNIGRGFIGALMSQAGYEVTFIDISDEVVDRLSKECRYPVRVVSNEGYEDIEITGVTAINGKNVEAVANAIAEADLMATAVGVNVLKYIVSNIAAGLRKRFSVTEAPLNIIICENLIDADKIMRKMLRSELSEEEGNLLDERVGLVEASIGRMVPVQTADMQKDEPLRVCVERYGYLPVDKTAFVGEIPQLKGMIPYEPFGYYIERKLFIHNMGHAICAYLGDYVGKRYIYESISEPDIYILVKNAMMESALALSKKYNINITDLYDHINDLLMRFSNAALKDTCERVGGDPKRKLGPSDRLIGASLMCIEQSVNPVHICLGTAGALFHYLKENHLEQTKSNAKAVLTGISKLDNDTLTETILHFYEMLLNREIISNIRNEASKLAVKLQGDVV